MALRGISAVFLLIAFCDVSLSNFINVEWYAQRQTADDLCLSPEQEFVEDAFDPKYQHTTYKRKATLDSPNLQAHPNESIQEMRHSLHLANKALERIYDYDIILSKPMLDNGISNLGDPSNMRKLLHKLVTGEKVTIVALGASITKGHGPYDHANSWLNRFYTWINETFPHPDHELLNKAIPGTASNYVTPCILDMVPADTDLVLLEFAYNDARQGYPPQLEMVPMRGFERLLRKLMSIPGQPGILYMYYWAERAVENYMDTTEDAANTLLKFYGLSGLSMRDSLHQSPHHDALVSQVYHMQYDHTHPTCIGSRFFVDLLIGHLQDLAALELTQNYTIMSRAVHRKERAIQEWPEAVRTLGPSLQKENGNLSSDFCFPEPEFLNMVRVGQGFSWINEARPGQSPKFGFVAKQPGDHLEVDVRMDAVPSPDNTLTVGLGFLVSYQHMGMAHVACKSGCTCKGRDYSFLHPPSELTSISAWKTMEVGLVEGSKICTMTVEVLNQTNADPPEHKVKLTAAMVTAEKNFPMPCGGGDC